MSETTKTGYSLIKVRKETRTLFDQEAKRLDTRGLDETQVELLVRSPLLSTAPGRARSAW